MDAETYFRLACERALLDKSNRSNRLEEPTVIGSVLCGAGALDGPTKTAVLGQYREALRLRGHMGPAMFGPPSVPTAPTRLPPRRVIQLDQRVTLSGKEVLVESVSIGEDDVKLEVSGSGEYAAPVPNRARRLRQSAGGPAGALSFTVGDDQGTVLPTQQGGSQWGDRAWSATMTAGRLSYETTQLIVGDVVIDLPTAPSPPPVVIETIPPPPDPLGALLNRQIIAGLSTFSNLDRVQVTLDALVALRLLESDSSLVSDAHRIAKALTGAGRGKLPPPWSEVVERIDRHDGPDVTIPLGATIEQFAGCSLRFDRLRSSAESFSVDIAASPGNVVASAHPLGGEDDSSLQWWADDDRGHLYLMTSAPRGGSMERTEATVESLTPLDPTATMLRLLPTASTERAVVTVFLPTRT